MTTGGEEEVEGEEDTSAAKASEIGAEKGVKVGDKVGAGDRAAGKAGPMIWKKKLRTRGAPHGNCST